MSKTMKVKKKKQHISIGVSKTNFNRVKFGTKTLAAVLKLEGHQVLDGHLYAAGQQIHLSAVDLYVKEKVEMRPVKEAATA